MLKRFIVNFALVCVACAALPTVAQTETEDDRYQQIATEVPSDGFFPTPRMIELVIDRITEHMSDQFDFDSEQLDYVRTVAKSRIPQWLQLHKAEIKTLTNEYFEAILNDTPPSADDVSAWSDRVLPLVDGFQQVLETSAEDIGPVLTDDQLLTLEGDMAAFRVGMSFVRSKLELWREGEYDPEVDWPHGSKFKEMERAEQQVLTKAQEDARAEATGIAPETPTANDAQAASPEAEPKKAPASQPSAATVPQDEFDKYVNEFVQHYALTSEQIASANRYLREAKRQRDRYQTMKVAEFRQIEERLTAAQADDIPKIREEYDKLRAPINRYFQQLKDRLDKLPTRAQRKAATTTEINNEAPAAVEVKG